MSLLDHLLLFGATFANVFLLGFQSKNVHRSRYLLAAVTSVGITIAQYFFVKYAANDGGLEFLMVSGAGGALGIVAAIAIHDWMELKRHARSAA